MVTIKLDLHVHSIYSRDAGLAPKDIVEISVRKGLAGVAVTDHGTVKGGLKVKEVSPPGFIAIPGAEVKTSRGDLLVLFVEDEVKPGEPLEVIEKARELGGLVILPHPFDHARRATMKKAEEVARKVDAIEGFNSRCLSNYSNLRAVELAKALGKPTTGGSDAHFALELGRAFTLMDEAERLEDVREAILKGEVWVEGRLSPPYVHLMSRVRKTWMSLTSSLSSRGAEDP